MDGDDESNLYTPRIKGSRLKLRPNSAQNTCKLPKVAEPSPEELPVLNDDPSMTFSERAVREGMLASMIAGAFWINEQGQLEMEDSVVRACVGLEDLETESAAALQEYCQEEQRRLADLACVRSQLREAALLGRMAAACITRQEGESFSAVTEHASEPPPSPAPWQRQQQQQQVHREGPEERYRAACASLGVKCQEELCEALRRGGRSFRLQKHQYLGNRGAQALLPGLSELQELRHLDLAGQGLGNEAAVCLAQQLPGQLRELDLSRNQISEKGAQQLLAHIRHHPTLVRVSLDENPTPSWVRVKLRGILAERESAERERF